MTPKEALEAAAVMKAYSEGKTIQWHDHDDPPDDWSLCLQGDELAFDWACFDYCIKPEPKIVEHNLVQFNAETVPRDAWLRRREWEPKSQVPIALIIDNGIFIASSTGGNRLYEWDKALAELVFADTGKPFGRVEGE